MASKMIPGYYWYTPLGDFFVKLGLKCGGRVPPKPRRRSSAKPRKGTKKCFGGYSHIRKSR